MFRVLFATIFLLSSIVTANTSKDTIILNRDGSTIRVPHSKLSIKETSTTSFEGINPYLGLESIIGSDDRFKVYYTTEFPYRTTGRLKMGCTGTLIGPKHVLTAGHCVYDHDTQTWASGDELQFTPAQNGDEKPYGTIDWETCFSVSGYTEDNNLEYDYAVVILKEEIGFQTGWLAYRAEEYESLSNLLININGYPADKPEGSMWHSDCNVKDTSERMLYYDCDTFAGNSGSGIYRLSTNSRGEDERFVVGVHTLGVASDSVYNRGVILTEDAIVNINNWVGALPSNDDNGISENDCNYPKLMECIRFGGGDACYEKWSCENPNQ